MKKLLLLFALLLCVFSVFSQVKKIREFSSVPYEDEIETDEFTVLDINFDNNLVAFKHVFKLRTFYNSGGNKIVDEACDCKYAGMENTPLSGVVLGVYDLSKQDYVKTFTIYRAVYEKEKCTGSKLSQIMLDSAKNYFLENKLDITKKPKAINLVAEYDTVHAFYFKGILFKFDNVREYDTKFYYTTTSELFTYKKDVSNSEKLIYTIWQGDQYNVGSGGWVEYFYAFEKNGKFVFLNRFYHQCGDQGIPDSEMYHFSPVFKLSDFK